MSNTHKLISKKVFFSVLITTVLLVTGTLFTTVRIIKYELGLYSTNGFNTTTQRLSTG